MVTIISAILGAKDALIATEIDEDQCVFLLKKAIAAKTEHAITCDPRMLQLYTTQNNGEWLDAECDDAKAVYAGTVPSPIQCLLEKELNRARKIRTIFAGAPDDAIHVLVVIPPNDLQRPLKKQRLVHKTVPFSGPVWPGEYLVPLDMIASFRKIVQGFSRVDANDQPSYLLYGPRQFGKTTIAHNIMDWIGANPNWPDAECYYVPLSKDRNRSRNPSE